MAESGLTLSLAALRNHVAEHQFGPADYSALSTDEKARVVRVVSSGFRQFYKPPRISTNGHPPISHTWSFLWVNATLSLTAPYSTGTVTIVDGVVTLAGGTFPATAAAAFLLVNGVDYAVSSRDGDTQITLEDTTLDAAAGTEYSLHWDDYDLPDDFGHLAEESLTWRPAASARREIKLVSEGAIRALRSSPLSPGAQDPCRVAVRQKANVEATGTRSELLLWPAVQAAQLLDYRYHVRIPLPTDDADYVPGASDHSETILASCLAAGERMLDGSMNGPQNQYFQKCLEASIDFDRRNNRALTLGYNGDREPGGHWPRHPDVGIVLYGE